MPRQIWIAEVENLEVTTSAAGVPVSFIYMGGSWVVGVEPVRWYERVPWWETK